MTGHTHITARVFRKVTDMGAQAIPGAFAKFWTLYPRKVHQDEAARAWLSVGADDAAPAVMACLDRYLASDEVSRGVVKNAHNWLFEGARDRWEGEWPKPAKNGAHKQSRTEMLDEIMKDLPKGDWT